MFGFLFVKLGSKVTLKHTWSLLDENLLSLFLSSNFVLFSQLCTFNELFKCSELVELFFRGGLRVTIHGSLFEGRLLVGPLDVWLDTLSKLHISYLICEFPVIHILHFLRDQKLRFLLVILASFE